MRKPRFPLLAKEASQPMPERLKKPTSGRKRPLTSDEGFQGYIEPPLNENSRQA
jgi:hypothetical protein